MVAYRGTIYEGVMVNTYKAANALLIGDTARARVELNRANQRQANAVDQLAAKVQALRTSIWYRKPPDWYVSKEARQQRRRNLFWARQTLYDKELLLEIAAEE